MGSRRQNESLSTRKAAGEVEKPTGISDPSETPQNAEIVLDTVNHQPEENALRMAGELVERGFIKC